MLTAGCGRFFAFLERDNMGHKSNITIRVGAAHDSVTVDGVVFDRSSMDKPTRNKLRRMIVAAKRIEYGA